MADKKSKYIVSSRDKISSIGGDTTRNLHESFASEFLKYADEYNVHPFPRIVVSAFLKFSFLMELKDELLFEKKIIESSRALWTFVRLARYRRPRSNYF
ncbi:hypothetical protein QLX08_005734 [Tetragonisca angustula]|uniref:Uncharacterized protein n=1 Tax=Tetragonisca angustula TaxID=166442 RepID=A0AAW0ZWI4_9HYME